MLDDYNCFMNVSVAEAKNKLTELIKRVEDGEEIVIERRGRPVVQIVKAQVEGKRPLGFLRGKVAEIDPDWWKPMTDEEVEAFYEGTY